MQIKAVCGKCGHQTTRDLKAGDVVTPLDGSGMPKSLHSILFQGTGKGFRPVKVLKITDYLLAVEPAHWTSDPNQRQKDLRLDSTRGYEASTWIWGEKYSDGIPKVITEYGFWMDSRVSHLKEAVRD